MKGVQAFIGILLLGPSDSFRQPVSFRRRQQLRPRYMSPVENAVSNLLLADAAGNVINSLTNTGFALTIAAMSVAYIKAKSQEEQVVGALPASSEKEPTFVDKLMELAKGHDNNEEVVAAETVSAATATLESSSPPQGKRPETATDTKSTNDSPAVVANLDSIFEKAASAVVGAASSVVETAAAAKEHAVHELHAAEAATRERARQESENQAKKAAFEKEVAERRAVAAEVQRLAKERQEERLAAEHQQEQSKQDEVVRLAASARDAQQKAQREHEQVAKEAEARRRAQEAEYARIALEAHRKMLQVQEKAARMAQEQKEAQKRAFEKEAAATRAASEQAQKLARERDATVKTKAEERAQAEQSARVAHQAQKREGDVEAVRVVEAQQLARNEKAPQRATVAKAQQEPKQLVTQREAEERMLAAENKARLASGLTSLTVSNGVEVQREAERAAAEKEVEERMLAAEKEARRQMTNGSSIVKPSPAAIRGSVAEAFRELVVDNNDDDEESTEVTAPASVTPAVAQGKEPKEAVATAAAPIKSSTRLATKTKEQLDVDYIRNIIQEQANKRTKDRMDQVKLAAMEVRRSEQPTAYAAQKAAAQEHKQDPPSPAVPNSIKRALLHDNDNDDAESNGSLRRFEDDAEILEMDAVETTRDNKSNDRSVRAFMKKRSVVLFAVAMVVSRRVISALVGQGMV